MLDIAEYNHSNTHNANQRWVGKVISDKDYLIYERVNFGVITGTISFFGVVTNAMNIAVFYRQGYDTTMNISFMGLAISDLLSMLTMLLCNTFMSPFVSNLGVRVASREM